MDATERPAGSDPVKVTALTRSSEITAATSAEPISSVRNDPVGKPPFSKMSSRYSADCGTFDACLSSPVLPAISAGAANRMTCHSG